MAIAWWLLNLASALEARVDEYAARGGRFWVSDASGKRSIGNPLSYENIHEWHFIEDSQ
jgi:hypothetical protein